MTDLSTQTGSVINNLRNGKWSRLGPWMVYYGPIGPNEAKLLLSKNENNRSLLNGRVNRYSQSVNTGNWLDNPDGIKLDTTGNLIDGQHRLQTIVRTGRAVNMTVFLDCSTNLKSVLDTGKSRTAADISRLLGEDWGKSDLARANMLFVLDAGFTLREVPPALRVRLANFYADDLVFARKHSMGRGAIAGVQATIAWLGRQWPEEIADFSRHVKEFIPHPKLGTLISTVRRYLDGSNQYEVDKKSFERNMLVPVRICNAFQAWMKRENLAKFRKGTAAYLRFRETCRNNDIDNFCADNELGRLQYKCTNQKCSILLPTKDSLCALHKSLASATTRD